MLNRSLLAVYTALCLLLRLTTVPSGPTLVCKFTGEPMTYVVVNGAGPQRSCCAVSASRAADGTTRYALARPGCCDLRQGLERADAPAIKASSPVVPLAMLAAIPASFVAPVMVDAPVLAEVSRESAPRPPPRLSSASPRAPPRFS